MSSKMGTHRFALLALAMLMLCFAAAATQAKASPVSLTFDHGRFDEGIFRDRVILPATSTFPSDDLPTPQRTDIQLNGDLTDGKITIPAATNTGLQFPYMNLIHPLDETLKIPVTMRLNSGGLTGTWDAKSGAMTLKGKVDIIVVTGTGTNFPLPDSLDDAGVPPLGLFARCRFNDVPMAFSTATRSPFTGQPFTGGFGKNGAMTTRWDELGNATSENGGDCKDLNQLTHVEGGIWFSNGVAKPKPQPDKPGPTCATDLSLCPTPKYTEIDAVRLRPGKKVVKPGQKLVLTLKVHNSGNKTAKRLKVRIHSTRKAFRAPKTVTLTVPAGRSARKRFAVRITRGAKGRGRITAVNNGWSGSTYLKVSPKTKHRKR